MDRQTLLWLRIIRMLACRVDTVSEEGLALCDVCDDDLMWRHCRVLQQTKDCNHIRVLVPHSPYNNNIL